MTVTMLYSIFIWYPIFKNVKEMREAIVAGLEEKTDVATPDNNG